MSFSVFFCVFLSTASYNFWTKVWQIKPVCFHRLRQEPKFYYVHTFTIDFLGCQQLRAASYVCHFCLCLKKWLRFFFSSSQIWKTWETDTKITWHLAIFSLNNWSFANSNCSAFGSSWHSSNFCVSFSLLSNLWELLLLVITVF